MQRSELLGWLEEILEPAKFSDYCPNGLQVEGTPEIRKLITGVTASQALIDEAIKQQADGILVHHGWFWRGEDPTIRGTRRNRLASVLAHNLNLFAFHLPLDAHPEYGNNVQLAKVLGIKPELNEQGRPVTGGAKTWFGSVRQALSSLLASSSPDLPIRLEGSPCSLATPSGHANAWRGAPGALRACLRLRLMRALTPTSRVRSQNPMHTWLASQAWRLSALVITPQNVTASKRLARRSASVLTSMCHFLILTTLLDPAGLTVF